MSSLTCVIVDFDPNLFMKLMQKSEFREQYIRFERKINMFVELPKESMFDMRYRRAYYFESRRTAELFDTWCTMSHLTSWIEEL